jgi:hypothetical protein
MLKKGKKAQFFLVFAVIIGILMLSIISLTNKVDVTNKNAKQIFDVKCENYRREVFRISEQAVATGNKAEEYTRIYDFTTNFFKEMNKTLDFEMIFLYGDAINVAVVNYFNETLEASDGEGTSVQINNDPDNNFNYISGQRVTVSSMSTGFSKTYTFNKDTSFYFYMKAHKGEEIYTCE